MHDYYVYILASKSLTLYTGVTRDLVRRVAEHKSRAKDGFTTHYHINRLLYYESTNDIRAAIAREKQIKGWRRSKKFDLILARNPDLRDLSDGWYD